MFKGLLDEELEIAIKEIDEELLKTSAEKQFAVMSFLHEIKNSSLVKHKNFGRLYGICIEKRFLIISEFISGTPLDEMLRQSVIEVPLAMDYIEQLIDGMIYLHSNSEGKRPIIHKDLKPANIMIDENGILKIIDLGISGLTKLED